MNLVQIRGYDFLAEFVGLRAHERNVQSGEDSDQGLQSAVGVNVGMSIRRLHLAERGCADESGVLIDQLGGGLIEPNRSADVVGRVDFKQWHCCSPYMWWNQAIFLR